MAPQFVVDYRTVSVVVVLAFALVGAMQGGARSIVVVAVSLAVIVGIGEPNIAAAMLRIGEKVSGILRRAVGAGAPGNVTDPGPYYFVIYLAVLLVAVFLGRAVVREAAVSKGSRLFGGFLGVLNGLLFSLMLRENLLPAIGQALGSGWTIHVRLGADGAGGPPLVGGNVSVGTVAYVFGLLLAGAGVLRKVRAVRGTTL
jgi:hypothetical protein